MSILSKIDIYLNECDVKTAKKKFKRMVKEDLDPSLFDSMANFIYDLDPETPGRQALIDALGIEGAFEDDPDFVGDDMGTAEEQADDDFEADFGDEEDDVNEGSGSVSANRSQIQKLQDKIKELKEKGDPSGHIPLYQADIADLRKDIEDMLGDK